MPEGKKIDEIKISKECLIFHNGSIYLELQGSNLTDFVEKLERQVNFFVTTEEGKIFVGNILLVSEIPAKMNECHYVEITTNNFLVIKEEYEKAREEAKIENEPKASMSNPNPVLTR